MLIMFPNLGRMVNDFKAQLMRALFLYLAQYLVSQPQCTCSVSFANIYQLLGKMFIVFLLKLAVSNRSMMQNNVLLFLLQSCILSIQFSVFQIKHLSVYLSVYNLQNLQNFFRNLKYNLMILCFGPQVCHFFFYILWDSFLEVSKEICCIINNGYF